MKMMITRLPDAKTYAPAFGPIQFCRGMYLSVYPASMSVGRPIPFNGYHNLHQTHLPPPDKTETSGTNTVYE